jgi:hypothetical protein
VFQPSNGTQGAAFNHIRQSKSSAAAPGVAFPSSPTAPRELQTSNDHPSPAESPPQSSPILPPHLVSPSVMTNSTGTKRKHSARETVGSLPTTFVDNFISTSDGSSRSRNISSKRQKVTAPSAILATSKELKDFNNTVKDLISLKEVRNRKDRRERASSAERRTRTMRLFQKQESGWLPFDHQIAMIDHFKLDVGSADAYMMLEQPMLRKLWVKKQLKDMQYVVDDLDVEGGPSA